MLIYIHRATFSRIEEDVRGTKSETEIYVLVVTAKAGVSVTLGPILHYIANFMRIVNTVTDN